MATLLFTLVKSPFEKNEMHTMTAIARDQKRGVMLFEDAVYYATNESTRKDLLSKQFSIFAIEEELKARGFEQFAAKGLEVIDYDTAVDIIMEQYDKVVSL